MSDAVVRGVVHLIEETKSYGQKGFRKRMVVLQQEKGSFTNYIPVEFLKDGCDAVDELSVGEEIEVTYRLTGRRWQKDASSDPKYFLSAEAISFHRVSGGGSGGRGRGGERVIDINDDPNAAFAEAGEDDVPF